MIQRSRTDGRGVHGGVERKSELWTSSRTSYNFAAEALSMAGTRVVSRDATHTHRQADDVGEPGPSKMAFAVAR